MKHLLYLLFLISITSNCQPISGTSLRLTGTSTMSILSSDQDNYTLPVNKTMYRVSSNTPINITGIAVTGGNNGLRIVIKNIGSNAITLKNEDDGSLAQNRFNFAPGVDISLGIDQPIELIYDTDGARWNVNATFTGVSGITAPEAQDTDIQISAVTTTTATVSWVHTEGDFSIVLLDNAPIVDFPLENVSYDPGEQIGDAFVMGNVSGTDPPTLDITGLTQNTTYYVTVFSYNTQDGAYRYNTTVDTNTDSFTTLSDVTTPTDQFVTTTTTAQQDQIRIEGVRGSGDAIIAVVSEHEIDADPVDGVTYSVGNEIGTGNFVNYIGTAADFFLTTLTRDTKYYWKIMEYENTGKLYNRIAPIDSLRTAYIYTDDFADYATDFTVNDPGGFHPGYAYLTSNAAAFYYFKNLTGTDGSVLSGGNAGLNDLGSSGTYDLTPLNSVQVDDISIDGNTVKSQRSHLTECSSLPNTGSSWFNGGLIGDSGKSGFEVIIKARFEDGQTGTGNRFFLGVSGGSRFCVGVNDTGQLFIIYQSSSGNIRVWGTTASALTDGVNAERLLRFRLDFTADLFSIYMDGVAQTCHAFFNQGTLNPSAWSNSDNIYVGSENTGGGGGAQSNSGDFSIFAVAITQLLTTAQADDVSDLFDTGDEGSGGGSFTDTVTGGELILDGDPAGWQSWVQHDDVIPDNLEEFEFETIVRLDNAPDATSFGFSIGIKNDLASEANRGVVAFFGTETDNAAVFNKLFIYSGDGSVNQDAFVYRSQSASLGTTPANDNIYRITFRRELQVNDALYTAIVEDITDDPDVPPSITTTWTEVGRPSSAFFGTSIRTYFHQNGGSNAIDSWVVSRTGDDTDVTPPPTPTAFDIYVDFASGNDGNPGTQALPKKTLEAGVEALRLLGGSVGTKKLSVASGTYTLGAFQLIPANCGLIEGAGIGVTIITGGQGLTGGTTISGGSRHLFQISNGGATETGSHQSRNITLKNMTFDGRNRTIVGGVYVNYVDDVFMENLRFQNFNSDGVLLFNTVGGSMTDCQFEAAGGVFGSNVGLGAIMYYRINEWEFDGGFIKNDASSAYGYGFKMLAGTAPSTPGAHLYTDISVHDMDMRVFPYSLYNGSNYTSFAMEFHTGGFNNIEIYNNVIKGGNLFSLISLLAESGQGAFRIHHNDMEVTGGNNLSNGVFEIFAQFVEIDNNYVYGAINALVYAGGGVNFPGYSRDFTMHHNVFEVWGGSSDNNLIGSSTMRWIDFHLHHNTFIAVGSVRDGAAIVYTDQNSGSPSTIIVEDNAFHGVFSTLFIHKANSGFTGTARNNKSTNLNVNGFAGPGSGSVTFTDNQIHGSGNSLGLKLTGSKYNASTFTFGAYYQPNVGSVLIDADHTGTADIGAIEH